MLLQAIAWSSARALPWRLRPVLAALVILALFLIGGPPARAQSDYYAYIWVGIAQVGVEVGARIIVSEEEEIVLISNEAWQWQRSATETGPYNDIPAAEGGASSSYTPSADELGKWLKVRVTYDVGATTGNTIESFSQPVLSQPLLSNAGISPFNELIYASSRGSAVRYAQAFTTGSHVRGYRLNGVRLGLADHYLPADAAWAVHADDAGKPEAGPLSGAFPISHAEFADGEGDPSEYLDEFTHPDGLHLEPDTKYWIVINQTTPLDDIDSPRNVIGVLALTEAFGALEAGLETPPLDAGSAEGWSMDYEALTPYYDRPDYDYDDNPDPALLPWWPLTDALKLVGRSVLRMSLLGRVEYPEVTVQFGASDGAAAEGDDVMVTVELSADPERTITIPIETTNQGGATSADYSGLPDSVTFNAGETRKTITFSATQDDVDDNDESVLLGFGTLPEGMSEGSLNEATVSIDDDDDPIVAVSFGGLVISPVASVTDGVGGYPELGGAWGIATHTIGGSHYALVAAYSDHGVQIIDITDPASPSPVASVTDSADYPELDGARGIAIHTIGGSHYALVASLFDNGVQIIDITDPASPSPVAHVTDSTAYPELNGAADIAVHTIGGRHYALVAAEYDDGVQIIDITDPASPSPVASVTDGADYPELDGARGIATHTIGGKHYALVAARADDGVQIIDITTPAIPSPVASVTDGVGGYDKLSGAAGIATHTIGGKHYALVSAGGDNGVQVIDITDPSSPYAVASVDDRTRGYSELDGAWGIATHTIGGRHYALVASQADDGVQIIDITDPSSPSPVTSATDGANYPELDGARGIATHTIGGKHYALVASQVDDGVQIIQIEEKSSYTVAEGGTVDVEVTLSADPERTVTISITATDRGGATSADYSVPQSVTFNAGETRKTVTFIATQDTVDDDGESVLLGFGTLPEGVSEGSLNEATVSIDDDDVAVSFGHDSYTVDEGRTEDVTVTLSEDPERTVTIPITATLQGGATSADYSGVPDSVTFNSGETSKSFAFSATQDDVDDDGESVKLGFGTLPEGVSEVSPVETTVSIDDDDDPQVAVSFEHDGYILYEGETVDVTVTLSADPERTVTISITATDRGGATSADYSVPQSVTFNAGETSKTVTFTAVDDVEDDDGESVKLGFGTLPEGVSEGSRDEVTVSIGDDDDPIVTVMYGLAAYTVDEGEAQQVTVTLSADPERTVVIPVTATLQGGATSADYSGVPDSVTFNAGETRKTITFSATQDAVDDNDESVLLGFGTLPEGVSEGSLNEATVSIDDDDVAVSFGHDSYTVDEGRTEDVTVTLSEDPERTVTIPITATLQGGATSADYSVPQSVTFNAGETSKTVTFIATQDAVDDDGESVLLGFGTLPEGVSEGSLNEATVSIDDDDVAVSFGHDSYTVDEGRTEDVTVTLSEDPERTVTIPITATLQGGATSADYSGVPDSVTFNSGETSKSFAFSATQDAVDDDDESVLLGFGTLRDGVVEVSPVETTVSITDDDDPHVAVSFGGNVAISPVASVTDGVGGYPELDGASGVATHTIGGRHYALVAAYLDDGVQIIDITDPANPSAVASVTDSTEYPELDGATGIAIHTIGGRHYALVAAWLDDGVQIIDITDPASPSPVAAVTDGVDGYDALRWAAGIATHTIGGRHYALVAALLDSGVQIIDITDPASPSAVASVTDGRDYPELDGARGIATHTIGGRHYALVAAQHDDGVQIIDITDPANPSPVASVTDGVDYPELDGARGIATHTIGGKHYALVAARADDGVQVIDITDPASPSPVASVTHSATYRELEGAVGIATHTIGGKHYALVAAGGDNGVQVIDITTPAIPSPVASATDGAGGYDELEGAVGIAIHTIGGKHYALVSAFDDDGVQIIQVEEKSSYTVAEGGTVDVVVTLDADPERTVTISITATPQGGAVAGDYMAPTEVTFNTGETRKTVTFSATQDQEDDNDESVLLGFGSSLPDRVSEGSLGEVTVNIDDDDVSVSFGQDSYSADEGGTVDVEVTLSEDPERTVTIPITATPQGGAVIGDYTAPTGVTFNAGETRKTVTFIATQDTVDDDGESVKLGFGTLPEGVSEGSPSETTVSIVDDDVAGIALIPALLTVEEGSAAEYGVALDTEPTTTVTVTVSGHSGTDLTLSGSTLTSNVLTFTTTNWPTLQAVTVTAADDDDIDVERITLTHTASGGGYDGVVKDLSVIITEDDGALRLVDGRAGETDPDNEDKPSEGRLEVFHGGEWCAVCDDYWTKRNADVACRQLGFAGGTVDEWHSLRNSAFPLGPKNQPIALDDVRCTRNERELGECRHRGWRVHNCQLWESVGLRCIKNSEGPYVTNMEIAPPAPGSNGQYRVGDTLRVTVTWSEPVHVEILRPGGFPSEPYARGPYVRVNSTKVFYASGSGTATTVLQDTVKAYDRNAPYTEVRVGRETLSTEIWNATPGPDPVGSYVTSVATGKPAILRHKSYPGPDLSQQQVEAVRITGAPAFNDAGDDGVFGDGETVEVTFTFSRPVTVDTTGGVPKLEIMLGGSASRQATYLKGSGASRLVFGYTLTASDGEHNFLVVDPNTLTLNGGAIRDAANNLDADISHVGAGSIFLPAQDATAPRLQSASVDGASLTLAFDEELDKAVTLPSSGLFAVNVNGAARPVLGVAVGEANVVLLLDPAVEAGDTVAVDYTAPADETAGRVQDMAGNAAASFSGQAVINYTAPSGEGRSEQVQPPGSLRLDRYETGQLRASWEAPGSGPEPTGYTVQWKRSADAWGGADDVSEANVTGVSHVITGLTDGVEYAVRVIAKKDGAASEPTTEGTATPQETTPPSLSAASVDGAALTLTFDEPLDAGHTPDASAFEVSVAGSDRGVEAVAVSGGDVTLTLATPALSGENVTVAYTAPMDESTVGLQDLAGNAAASFTGQAVTNDTQAADSLTASVSQAPEFHDGSATFIFELRFSEEPRLGYKTMRDHVFTVTGGEVVKARRLAPPSNVGWEISVRPDSNGTVTVVLPATTDCDAEGAVCTEDGRPLSERVEVTVPGPQDEDPPPPPQNNEATGSPAIAGTARVGETLTSGTSGISDADGMDNASFAYQWLADDVEISGATGSTLLLISGEVGKAIRVRVSFTDDAGNAEAVTSAATAAVAAAPEEEQSAPLTATVSAAPSSHDGSATFTFELRLSEEPKNDFSYRTLRDHAFTVTGGEVVKARRLAPPSNIGWEITVRPDSNGTVTIVLPATEDCDDDGAICTGDGRMLSNRNEFTVSGPGE